MKRRQMAMVINKMTFAEAEEQDIAQWQNVSFEERWASLERLRKMFYEMQSLPFPEKMERVITIVKK